MTQQPYWHSPFATLYQADARALPLPDKSVHACFTSPPYYQLRRYGVDGEIGLEQTPAAFIAELVAAFREVKRALRDDGTLLINMGDSYAGGGRGGGGPKQHTNAGSETVGRMISDMEGGNLLGIPWRLALALQEDGWIWRETVYWVKKSPMPESLGATRWERCRVKVAQSARGENPHQESYIRQKQGAGVASRAQREAYFENGNGAATYADCPGCPKCAANDGLVLRRGSWRHTDAVEPVMLFVKGMGYYFDKEAMNEPNSNPGLTECKKDWRERPRNGEWPSGTGGRMGSVSQGRNPRNVLPLGPEPFGGQHFATFPTALPRHFLRGALSEKGCCPRCGAQLARVV